MRLRCTSDRTRMPRQGLLDMNGNSLRGCPLSRRHENSSHEQASAEGECAFEHNLFLRQAQPRTEIKVAEEARESLQPVGKICERLRTSPSF